ncbi:hypothetical protein PHISCL_01506 [Aspergillus sclerotialis]|uniref:Zn(2)-C6 fungal-type domain-containing protein n=1 Tax=Aspergillus sclerotialis TaxID=2070753 RepID=A0A3A2ZSX6_9EURO|nr:hypothetical protein PHISCL_01506 [Aspergillus sclerotialis]
MEGTETQADSGGRPAPYGRACANCARAKCRCILRNNGGSCERCFRLQKECAPSATRKRRRPNYHAATARLEQKVDGLVSILKASNGSFGPFDIHSSSPLPSPAKPVAGGLENSNKDESVLPNSGHYQTSTMNNHHQYQQYQKHLQLQDHGPQTPVSTSSSSSFPYILPHGAEPSPEEAEQYFQIFRTKHLSFLPFIRLGQEMTSRKLRHERPFLWLCIMADSSTNVAQQNAIGQTVREIAAREIIMEGERSMDLLLGLLCFIGWGHFRFSMGPLLTVLSHLCISLTLDLELQKRCPMDGNISHIFPRSMPSQFQGKIRIPEQRNIEHRRTALACYFLTSSAASFHSRVESLSWSPYLEECLKVLENSKEAPGDSLLVYFVKVQRIINNATTVRVQMRDTETEESTRIIGQYISSLNGQLTTLKSQIPAHLVTNKILQTMNFHTEITINELILMRIHHVPLSTNADPQTMNSLYTCLNAVKSWLDTILQFEGTDYATFPFFFWKQFRSVILTLIRLTSLKDPAWDTNIVRRTVNLPAALDQIGRKLGYLQNRDGEKAEGQDNAFTKSVTLVNGLKNWSRSVYNETGADAEIPSSSPSIITDSLPSTSGDGLQQSASVSAFADMDAFFSFDQEFWGGDMFGLWPNF